MRARLESSQPWLPESIVTQPWGTPVLIRILLKLTVTFLVGSPVHINNRGPVSQVPFPQFRVIERFCVESSTRIGVGRLGACLHRWGILDTPKCICGTEEQSYNL